jgi:hypothetical protein
MIKTEMLETETFMTILESLSPIMFDHFYGQEKDTRPPEQKFYLGQNNEVVFPSENIRAFLLSEKGGCARSFEGRKGKEFVRVAEAHIIIEPLLIPFIRKGKPIVFDKFDGDTFWISEFAPTTKLKGGDKIKQDIRKRPVLNPPWELSFTIKLIKNDLIDENRLYNWFVRGGIEIGLGNYRPRFGRFMVKKFE